MVLHVRDICILARYNWLKPPSTPVFADDTKHDCRRPCGRYGVDMVLLPQGEFEVYDFHKALCLTSCFFKHAL